MFTIDQPDNEMRNILPEWHEPFPEPQTIPIGWDLSGVLPESNLAIEESTGKAIEG